MNDKMTLYLSAPPNTAEKAFASGFPVALMAYKTGQGFHLYRTAIPDIRPALIYINCSQFTGFGPHRILGGEIMGECIARGASGIVLDLGSFTAPVISFCTYISHAAKENGLTVYLPYLPQNHIDGSAAIIPTAIDNDGLEKILRKAIGELGAENLALQVECIFRSYSIPCRSGNWLEPKNLSPDALMASLGAESFFSKELCVNYFPYTDRGDTRVVLYDDLHSIKEKINLASSLGIKESFLYYPQVEDITGDLRLSFLETD